MNQGAYQMNMGNNMMNGGMGMGMGYGYPPY